MLLLLSFMNEVNCEVMLTVSSHLYSLSLEIYESLMFSGFIWMGNLETFRCLFMVRKVRSLVELKDNC